MIIIFIYTLVLSWQSILLDRFMAIKYKNVLAFIVVLAVLYIVLSNPVIWIKGLA